MLLPCVPAAVDQPLPCAGKAMNSAAAHICGSPHSLSQVWFSKSHLNEDGEGEQRCIVSVCLLACLLARLLIMPLLSQAVGTHLHSSPARLLAGTVVSPYKRVIMFVDNAGADVVLGMLPFARELLRMGSEVGGARAHCYCGLWGGWWVVGRLPRDRPVVRCGPEWCGA